MAEENHGQDVNIMEVANGDHLGGGDPGTQTPVIETPAAGEDTKAEEGEDEGTGTDGGTDGGEDGADSYAPDADGKYTHPETKAKVDAPEMIKYLKEKFGASTAGAQALLAEKTTIEKDRDDYKGKVTALETKITELTQLAEGKNPEGLSAVKLKEQLDSTVEQLAILTENNALNEFEKTTPLATGKIRESLKALARANPSTSLQQLYDENLKAGAEATEAKRVKDEEARKKGAGDRGRGTSTREQTSANTVQGNKGDTGLTVEEFNKLPVVKRAALIQKYDIR